MCLSLQRDISFLDIAEAILGRKANAHIVRLVLKIWRGMRTLAQIFAEANDDGILIADYCIFNPNRDRDCGGGIM